MREETGAPSSHLKDFKYLRVASQNANRWWFLTRAGPWRLIVILAIGWPAPYQFAWLGTTIPLREPKKSAEIKRLPWDFSELGTEFTKNIRRPARFLFCLLSLRSDTRAPGRITQAFVTPSLRSMDFCAGAPLEHTSGIRDSSGADMPAISPRFA